MDKESERTSYAHPPAIMSALAKNRPTRPPQQQHQPPPVVDENSLSAVDEDDEVKVYGDEGAVEEEKRCSKTLVEDKHELVNFGVDRLLAPSSTSAAAAPLHASAQSAFLNLSMAQYFAACWPAYNAALLASGGRLGSPFGLGFAPMSPAMYMPQPPALPARPPMPRPPELRHPPSMMQPQRQHQHQHHRPPPAPVIEAPPRKEKPHVKKPLNAFMLFMKEERPKVLAESDVKESAAINAILGQRWHGLSNEEKSKYFKLATEERRRHMEEHPDWSARDNYGIRKKGKRKRERHVGEENSDLPRKCRARFGVEHPHLWCKPCRRKKKCIRFGEDDEPISNAGSNSVGGGGAGTENDYDDDDEDGDDYESYDEDMGPREAKMNIRPISNMPLVFTNADNINRER